MKKLIYTLTAVALAASLCGCSSDTGTDNTEEATKKSHSTKKTTEADEDDKEENTSPVDDDTEQSQTDTNSEPAESDTEAQQDEEDVPSYLKKFADEYAECKGPSLYCLGSVGRTSIMADGKIIIPDPLDAEGYYVYGLAIYDTHTKESSFLKYQADVNSAADVFYSNGYIYDYSSSIFGENYIVKYDLDANVIARYDLGEVRPDNYCLYPTNEGYIFFQVHNGSYGYVAPDGSVIDDIPDLVISKEGEKDQVFKLSHAYNSNSAICAYGSNLYFIFSDLGIYRFDVKSGGWTCVLPLDRTIDFNKIVGKYFYFVSTDGQNDLYPAYLIDLETNEYEKLGDVPYVSPGYYVGGDCYIDNNNRNGIAFNRFTSDGTIEAVKTVPVDKPYNLHTLTPLSDKYYLLETEIGYYLRTYDGSEPEVLIREKK